MASVSEENAHLLYALKEAKSARGFGAIAGFFEAEATWRCPCCYRSKGEFARLDKNGNLLCQIVFHHDHFGDEACERLRALKTFKDWQDGRVTEESFSRFPPVMICQDCNVADPAAKAIVAAPKAFSFAPCEIACFVRPSSGVPHRVDVASVQKVYRAAHEVMLVLEDRLIAIAGPGEVPSRLFVARVA